MRFVALGILAVVGVTVVTACGSSHGRAGSGGAIEIHLPTRGTYTFPARGHRHSVRQIEAAFVSQGIHLHKTYLPKTSKQLMPSAVVLRYGSRTNFVTVAVVGSEQGNFEFLGVRNGSPRPRVTHHGDLIVFYDPGHSAAVKSALAELR